MKAHSRKSREAIDMGAKRRRKSDIRVSQVTAKVQATDKTAKQEPKKAKADKK